MQKTIVFDGLALDSVNRSSGYRIDASGKAVNAARVLNQLEPGCVSCIAPLGTDNAQLFLELAEQDRLKTLWIRAPGRTRYCYTLVDPRAGSTTELVVSEPLDSSDQSVQAYKTAAESLCTLLKEQLPDSDALLVAGSRPEAWPEDLGVRLCAAAKEQGKILMADFHGADLLACLEHCIPDIIKINEEEFSRTFAGTYPLTEDALTQLLRSKSAELGTIIVITRSDLDIIASRNGLLSRQPVEKLKALNTIGCGDSFSAGFLHTWLLGGTLQEALERAAWCASRNALNIRPGSIWDPEEEGEQLW